MLRPVRFRLPALVATALLPLACGTAPSVSVTGLDGHRVHPAGDGPRVLCVIAHPDDEIAFAGTVYKIATHLGGACDIVVITNGEGGYKYSTLGELIYHVELTDPEVGRALLPGIRRDEFLEGCAILHVHEAFFLHQKDHRNTLDAGEVLAADAGVWDLSRVRAALRRILASRDYDFVLTHLPVPDTHGHHKAASILALEALAELAPEQRPVALGAFSSGRDEEHPAPPEMLAGYPVTRIRTDAGPFVFDRRQKFGYRDRLDYQIVVNWAIAAHKSQGTFQGMMNRWDRETFYLYAIDPPDAADRAARLFASLAEPQFEARAYDENGEER